MKFIVRVHQAFEKEFKVEAKSLKKAKRSIEAQLKSGGFQFSNDDIVSTSLYGYQDDCVEDGDDLIESCFWLGSTVSLMDQFEMRNPDNTKKYRRLILENFSLISVPKKQTYWVNLIIERVKYGDRVVGDITMSELKGPEKHQLVKIIEDFLISKCSRRFPRVSKEIKLKIPYLLRAQTSADRRPGGWTWGTKYGDTHRYGVVGFTLNE